MASEPEVRGMLEYVIARRNIAAILTFGESDNLIAAPTRTGALAPASTVDLIAFANQSVEGARTTGRFQSPQGFFGGRGAAAVLADAGGRGAGGRGGGRGGHAAGDDRRNDRRRILPHHQRQLPSADRHSHGAGDAHPRRRVLRVRLLPVRRAVVLDTWMGHQHFRRGVAGGPAGAGRPVPGAAPQARVQAPGPRWTCGGAWWRRQRGRRTGQRRIRSAARALDGCRKGERLHRVGAVQASLARRCRDRRVPSLRLEQP